MKLLQSILMRSPSGEDEGNITENDTNKSKASDEKAAVVKEGDNEKPSFLDKVHDALQEWSNDDQREQEFDDTRP